MAGDKIFLVRDVFPHLAYFTAFVIFVGFPLIVIIGKLHYRYAYKSESDIMMLKNPYIDKIELPLFNQLVIALLQEDPKNKELLKLHKLIQELKEGTNQLDN